MKRTTAQGSEESARVVARLNRGVRNANARLSPAGQFPFGNSMMVYRYRLGNGLNVLVGADRTAPTLSYQTWYCVGSRHERPKKTGLAHLFEHLMFNETKNLPAGEFDRLIESIGGETNAATWTDWTYYYENVPASQLELIVRLESDRMANLVVRDAQVISEKEVVANERRFRVEDDVEGAANERLYALAFRKHPYHWPTIGWMSDIERFNPRDCLAFYETFYAPNNANLILIGDIDIENALSMVQKYYGPLRPAPIPKEKRVVEPKQRSQRALTMRQETPTQKFVLGYRSPGFGHPDWITLSVMNEILFGGRSSRMYRELVHELEIASEVRGSLAPFHDPGLYEVWVSMRPKLRNASALRVVEREFRNIVRESVTDEELEKARNRLELSFLEGMETASGKAEQIGFHETVLGDASTIFPRLDLYRRVNAKDICEVAKKYLVPSRRSIVNVLSETKASSKKARANGAEA